MLGMNPDASDSTPNDGSAYNPGLPELINYYALVIGGVAVALYILYCAAVMGIALTDAKQDIRLAAGFAVITLFTAAAFMLLNVSMHFVRSIRRAHAARARHRG